MIEELLKENNQLADILDLLILDNIHEKNNNENCVILSTIHRAK
jgi:hypothetical protein